MYPVQCGIGKYGIKRFVNAEVRAVGDTENQSGVVFFSFRDHLRRGIDPDNIRAFFLYFFGEMAGTTTQIKDTLAGLYIQQLQHTFAVLEYESMFVVI